MQLIEQCRAQWWRLWSVRINAVYGALAGALTLNQSIAIGLLWFVPDGVWRWVAAFVVALVVFVVPTLARVVQQPRLTKDAAAKDA